MTFRAKIDDRIVVIEYNELGFKVSDAVVAIDLNTSEGKQKYCTIADKVIEGKSPLDCIIKLLTGKRFGAMDLPNDIESCFVFTTKSDAKKFSNLKRDVYHNYITNEFGFVSNIEKGIYFDKVGAFKNDNNLFVKDINAPQIPLVTGFLSFISTYLIK